MSKWLASRRVAREPVFTTADPVRIPEDRSTTSSQLRVDSGEQLSAESGRDALDLQPHNPG